MTLTEDEIKALTRMVDAGVRATGLQMFADETATSIKSALVKLEAEAQRVAAAAKASKAK